MDVTNWGYSFTESFINVGTGVLRFIPLLLGAIVVFAIGWLLATLVEKLIEGLFKTMKVDAALKSAGLEEVVKRSGYNLNSGRFIGALVKWFVIVVFLIVSFDIVELSQVNFFLRDIVLSYLPQVIVAALILMIAVVISDAVQKVVIATAKATHIKSAALLGSIAKWAIWIFAIIAMLIQLGIAASIIMTLFTGVVAGSALAFGLAFGLGGKDAASRILERTIHAVSERE